MVIDPGRQGEHGDAVAYVLGALDPAARQRFESHAATCAECLAELEALQPVADLLGLPVPQVDPPPDLVHRLLARAQGLAPTTAADAVRPAGPVVIRRPLPVGAPAGDGRRREDSAPAGPGLLGARQGRRRWWQQLDRLAAPLAAAALLLATFTTASTFAERQELRRTAAAAAELAETLSIMYQPGRVGRTLAGEYGSPGAKGMIYLAPDATDAVLVTYHMPPLPSQEVYQLWLNNPEKDWRVSGGTFQVDERGRGQLIVRAPAAFSQFRSCGVTREPGKGSPKPTGPRMLGGEL
jgi:anti-sigma-K factor RskA